MRNNPCMPQFWPTPSICCISYSAMQVQPLTSLSVLLVRTPRSAKAGILGKENQAQQMSRELIGTGSHQATSKLSFCLRLLVINWFVHFPCFNYPICPCRNQSLWWCWYSVGSTGFGDATPAEPRIWGNIKLQWQWQEWSDSSQSSHPVRICFYDPSKIWRAWSGMVYQNPHANDLWVTWVVCFLLPKGQRKHDNPTRPSNTQKNKQVPSDSGLLSIFSSFCYLIPSRWDSPLLGLRLRALTLGQLIEVEARSQGETPIQGTSRLLQTQLLQLRSHVDRLLSLYIWMILNTLNH